MRLACFGRCVPGPSAHSTAQLTPSLHQLIRPFENCLADPVARLLLCSLSRLLASSLLSPMPSGTHEGSQFTMLSRLGLATIALFSSSAVAQSLSPSPSGSAAAPGATHTVAVGAVRTPMYRIIALVAELMRLYLGWPQFHSESVKCQHW